MPVNYQEALRRRVQELRTPTHHGGGLPTGIGSLDALGGIRRGCLTIYGGATGEGKSVMKLKFASAVALAGLVVDVIDMEDPIECTADRTLSAATGLNNAHIANAALTDMELDRLQVASDESGWAERVTFHGGLITAPEALSIVRRSTADLVLVDYLQGFPDGDRGLERTIADFCWEVNKWAQQKNASVVAFSQVRADVEYRGLRLHESAHRRDPTSNVVEGFRPFGPGDLAWCTAAGQRCKELAFLFRPGRYLRRFNSAAKDDVLEISFPKRNWGQEGTVRLRFDGRTATVSDT